MLPLRRPSHKIFSKKHTIPEVDHRVSGQPAQSSSEYAVILKDEDFVILRPKDIVPLRYRNKHLRS
jgi:hypothetical protein